VAVIHADAFGVPATTRAVQAASRRGLTVLPWIWLAGAAILLGRMAIGYGRTTVLLRKAGSAGIVFADVSVPVVTGLLRPVILLPRSAEAWPDARMEAALRHERAHIGRNDLWTMLLAHVACAVYWFHPLVWMVAAQMRREQEHACDDAVILSGFEPASYAEALIAAAQNLTSTRFIGCHMLTQKTFKSRIARLLADGMPRVSSSSTLRRAAVIFAGAVVTIGLLSGSPQSPDGDGVYTIGPGISQPKVIYKIDPSYTEVAQLAKVSGTVALRLVIGTDGMAHDMQVIRTLGSGLDEKAMEAVAQWRFDPSLKDGEPVKVWATIEVNFRLK
jgi:TonB family protein